MLDRFYAFLDSPLDPRAGRAMLALAAAILLGFATVAVLWESRPDRPAAARMRVEQTPSQSPLPYRSTPTEASPPEAQRLPGARRQDPQDERDSPAAGRVAETLRSHRALQHVPYRRASLSVRLVGAHGARAVLLISAPTAAAAHRGWRAFLHRYRDGGRAYVPRFQTYGGIDG